jgi:hypothetical protein
MLDGGQMIYHTIRKIAITSGAIQTFDTKIIKKYLNNIWASVGIAFVLFITVIALITDFRKNLLI